ncbi:Out at first protein [Araneus ventricosus]|uniref:Out at first protein n=1 Tax=Araneus ventricosus TaxID=182803 RepID=A0A4Y2DJ63_ARAVE|nr:Out at first protein [Araneus ventricosus]
MFHIAYTEIIIFIFVVIYNLDNLKNCECQLVINVKNQGGDIVQESITSNITDDTITLEFQRPEGTLITQFVDFRSEVQVFRVLVLGEEERGQSQYQVLCFVTQLTKNDFISADAMSKLRQVKTGGFQVVNKIHPRSAVYVDLLDIESEVDSQTTSCWCGVEVWRGSSSSCVVTWLTVPSYKVCPKIALVLLQKGTLI